jgi:hypothetical protein
MVLVVEMIKEPGTKMEIFRVWIFYFASLHIEEVTDKRRLRQAEILKPA